MTVRVRQVGDTGVLVDCDGPLDAAALADRFRGGATSGLPTLVDVVPAARTVLVTAAPGALDPAAVRAWLRTALDGPTSRNGVTHPLPPLDLPVRFDGPDLASTAELLGLDADGLVDRVCGSIWTVAFTGFAPGFGYCLGGGLDVPRLDRPRTRVPARSVGLAGPYAGVYPRASPGGWRLLGTLADEVPELFDADREPPALLAPGREVRFGVAR